ncbi:hypothetical protein LINPERHAP2_LOCUS29200, partial [Linum perenne]
MASRARIFFFMMFVACFVISVSFGVRDHMVASTSMDHENPITASNLGAKVDNSPPAPLDDEIDCPDEHTKKKKKKEKYSPGPAQ